MSSSGAAVASAFPRKRVRRDWMPWVYCAPALLIIAGVAVFPLSRTVGFAFTDARLGDWGSARYVGLENFRYLLQDPDWWRAVANTLVFTGIAVTLETVLGTGVALILNERFRARGLLRAAVLIPWAIPTVVSARMWAWMFNDLYGVINELLIRSGLIHQRLAWLADPKLTLATVVAVDVWKTTPFMALLILAALQSVPQNLIEAAILEGISPWRRFWNLTLPLIRPGLTVAVIFRALDSLRIFDLPYVLTSNSRKTAVMSVYARQQLVDFQDVGYGSAASFLVFCVVAIVILGYLSVSGASVESEARR
jgi:trehalose/maltose transport system permease protein